MSTERRQRRVLALIVLAGACASILMFWITAHQPGVSSDSTVYIETATSLLSGNGFYTDNKPMTHFPPTYPLLLAVAGLCQHGDMLQAARLLGALLFGANIVLLGLAVQMCTAQSLWATGSAMLFVLLSPTTISTHSMAWSEPPFITFTLAALILLSLYVAHPKLYLLLGASLSVGLALTTRYAGVALLPPLVVALLCFGHRPLRRRIRDTILFATIASIPLALWVIRNAVTAQTLTNRTYAIHRFRIYHLKQLINTLHDFVFPIPSSGWTNAVYLVLAAAVFLTAVLLCCWRYAARFGEWRNYIRQNANSVQIALPALCMLCVLTYMIFLVVAICLFEEDIAFSPRMLLPALLVLTVAAVFLVWSLARVLDQRGLWYGVAFFALLFIGINGYCGLSEGADIHKRGRGYTSELWQNSQVLSYLANVGDARTIYSNGADVIRFLVRKEGVAMIPGKKDPLTRRVNLDSEEQLRRMSRECREGRALVAYFNTGIMGRTYLPSVGELESRGNLPVLRTFDDGVVYGKASEN